MPHPLFWRFVVALLTGYVLVMLSMTHAPARDVDGRYANSPNREWFDGLKAKSGLVCCSNADGKRLDDPDWGTRDGHYWVRVNGEEIEVPDEAVIDEPNRVGFAMVWPVTNAFNQTWIRCFMPGSQG